jgi:hypothetical protein
MNTTNKFNSGLKTSVIGILALSLLNACSDNEIDIPLSEVPGNIITIVQNTLPGISLTEAEKKVKKDVVIYELEGELINGKEYEIEITDSGTILKIELED